MSEDVFLATSGSSKLRSLFLLGAFAGGFYGYHFIIIGIHAAGLGLDSRLFSMPYRVGFLAFSLIIILHGILTRSFSRLGRLWIPLLIFWLLYFIRIGIDGYILPIPLRIEPIEYIQRAVGMTFIPMFIFLIGRSPKGDSLAFKAFWTFNIGCVVFALFFYRNIIGGSYRSLMIHEIDRATLLDPITLSYYGVIAALISFHLLLMDYSPKKLRTLLLFVVLIGGLAIIFLGETRSALLCVLLMSMVILFMSRQKPHDSSHPIVVLCIVTAIGVSSFMVMQWIGSETINRYEGMTQLLMAVDPNTGSGRLGIYQDTLDQIIKHPLFGSSLEIPTRMLYPHNHILEAFMTTGIIGGLSFIFLCWATLKRCFVILQKKTRYGWIAIIFMVYFFVGLFSSPIIGSAFWYSMLAVYAVPIDEFATRAFQNR